MLTEALRLPFAEQDEQVGVLEVCFYRARRFFEIRPSMRAGL